MGLRIDRGHGVERIAEAVGVPVPGMNWAMPSAPAGLRANGLKPDSAYSWAASTFIGTFQRNAARAIGSWKRAGTKPGRRW